MDTSTVLGVLNELLALEHRNLVPRLLESTVFVSQRSVEAMNAVRRMAEASKEHGAWLADAIVQLGGAVCFCRADTRSADLHFQELRYTLPRLMADREALTSKYALAAERVGGDGGPVQVVTRILERHREELTLLRQLAGDDVGAAG